MTRKVHLIPPKSIKKAKLLAPILPGQYKDRAATAAFPEELRLIGPDVAASPDRKLALVKNSKAGCTTAIAALYLYAAGEKAHRTIHRDLGVLVGKKGNIAAALDILTDPDCVAFTFVRHPEKRFLSSFRNFVLEGNNRNAPKFRKYLETFGWNSDLSEERQCDLFIDYIEVCFAEAKAHTDPHFRTQTINTAFGILDYKMIGRLENFSADMKKVFELAGVWDDRLSSALEDVRNPTTKKSFSLNPEQRKRVQSLYQEDYENFSY